MARQAASGINQATSTSLKRFDFAAALPGLPPGIPPRENAPAEKGSFKRIVAMIAAAAEAGAFARRKQSADGIALGVEHLAVEIGVDAAQRLARHDVQLDGDQRPL